MTLRIAIAFVAIAIGAALAAQAQTDAPNVGSLLFGDNFTSSPSSDINAGINSPTRTSGPLAGQISYDTANAMGNFSMDGGAVNLSGEPIIYPRVGLNYNFNGNLASGGLKISYDVKGNQSIDIDFLYTALDSSAVPEFPNNSNFNAWMTRGQIYADSQNWLYYGNNAGAGLYAVAGNTGAVFNDALHHMDIIATDATDAEPFNGAGTIQLDYYIDGAYISSYTGNDYANNYIGLEHQNYFSPTSSQFDNLQIYGNALLANTTVQWQGSGSNNWTDSASWTTGAIPNGRGAVALFLTLPPQRPTSMRMSPSASLVLKNISTTISSPTDNKFILWANAGTNSQIQAWDGAYIIASPNGVEKRSRYRGQRQFLFDAVWCDKHYRRRGEFEYQRRKLCRLCRRCEQRQPEWCGCRQQRQPGIDRRRNIDRDFRHRRRPALDRWRNSCLSRRGAKPTINVKTLGIGIVGGNPGSYSLDAGETVTVDNLTGGGVDLGYFHFNGGTLATPPQWSLKT